MLYLYSACLYGVVPNQMLGLLCFLRNVIIWAGEKCDKAVGITKGSLSIL
jgi:hypothetical protein